ncbi:hypothetical protein WME94_07255 [Sorangium sp. So ce429]
MPLLRTPAELAAPPESRSKRGEMSSRWSSDPARAGTCCAVLPGLARAATGVTVRRAPRLLDRLDYLALW